MQLDIVEKRITKINIRSSFQMPLLAGVCDVLAIAVCYMLACRLVPDILSVTDRSREMALLLLAYVGVVILLPALPMRMEESRSQVVSRALDTVLLHFLASAGLFVLAQLWLGGTLWVLAFWISMAFLLTLERLLLYALGRRILRRKDNRAVAVLVGDAKALSALYGTLSASQYSYVVEGIFCDAGTEVLPEGLTRLGTPDEAAGYVSCKPGIGAVFCQTSMLTQPQNAALFAACAKKQATYSCVPDFLPTLERRVAVAHVGGIPVISPVPTPLHRPACRMLKRTLDILLSLLCLVTVFPIIYIVVAVMTKRQSPGPVLCKRAFEGRNGRRCRGLCFRTSAWKDGEGTFPFGAYLQQRHLDEIPLLFSVLTGKMSLAGPRYHVCADMAAYHEQTDEYNVCQLLSPGLTGCGSAETADSCVAADVDYAQHWSIWRDLRLMCGKTIKALRSLNRKITSSENHKPDQPTVTQREDGAPVNKS